MSTDTGRARLSDAATALTSIVVVVYDAVRRNWDADVLSLERMFAFLEVAAERALRRSGSHSSR